MMTIRHVTDYGESLNEVTSVNLDASPGASSRNTIGTLHAQTTDGGSLSIDGGKVYVMNSAGKTVAVYDFFAAGAGQTP